MIEKIADQWRYWGGKSRKSTRRGQRELSWVCECTVLGGRGLSYMDVDVTIKINKQ